MRTLLFFLIIIGANESFGQYNLTIEGRVVDEAGNPIPYASILSATRRGIGTAANVDGYFKISLVPCKDTLICSQVNYQSKKVEVLGNNRIIFQLPKESPVLTVAIMHGESCAIPKKIAATHPVPDSIEKEDPNKIFEKLEVAASFQGGDRAFTHYLERNFKFPDSTAVPFTMWGEYDGKIIVRFTIDKEGNAINPVIIKGIDTAFEQIAKDLVYKMPRWQPAIQNGRNIESEREIAIRVYVTRKDRGCNY